MRTLALALLLAVAFASATSAVPPGPPTVRAFTLIAMTGGYNGTAPGPLLDVNVGDTVVVTLEDQLVRDISFHVHGMALAQDMDGISAHAATNFTDSTAKPGGSYTYTFRAPYVGVWHYHDHAEMSESAASGFYGTIVVRAPGDARPATALDVHLRDGVCPTIPASAVGPFELDVTALGNDVWTFTLDGASADLGPATSTQALANAGTSTWHATSLYYGMHCAGSVMVS